MEVDPSVKEQLSLENLQGSPGEQLPSASAATAVISSVSVPLQGPPTPPLPLPSQQPADQDNNIVDVSLPTPELDRSVLEIFGDDPSVLKEYGNEIQSDLAVRLQHIATNGLSKEVRKELCEKYLPPSNCTLIGAPELNAEIRAAVSEAVIKRDKGIEIKQKQLGHAITCISDAISILVSKEDKDMSIIKLLMDASRLLCDHQNQDSMTRRNFILFNLKKDMKDELIKTKVDKLLFGTDLAEKLKIAKSISKSSADLKVPTPSSKTPVTKNKAAPPTSAPLTARHNLNWKGPPLSRRPQANQRTREPAQRSLPAHHNSSQTSLRAQQKHRRR